MYESLFLGGLNGDGFEREGCDYDEHSDAPSNEFSYGPSRGYCRQCGKRLYWLERRGEWRLFEDPWGKEHVCERILKDLSNSTERLKRVKK